jgi:hypothetical protein
MNIKMLRHFSLIAFGVMIAVNTLAQTTPKVEFPAPSPVCTLKQRVGLTDFEIVYSRPGAKDRQVFGNVVPFGPVWRTGANNATKLTFNTAIKMNGTEIPAGTYALFTIPGESEWTIIISKNVTQSPLQYDEKGDVARFKVTPDSLDFHIETFTIEFNAIRDESAQLDLLWEKTVVPIKIEIPLTDKLVPQIEAVMASDSKQKPYYQAAMFYYDHGQDLQKAKEWVEAAIKQREAHYIVHLKAKILAKLGEKDAAITAANRSIELAKTAKDSAYVKLNEDLISSLK